MAGPGHLECVLVESACRKHPAISHRLAGMAWAVRRRSSTEQRLPLTLALSLSRGGGGRAYFWQISGCPFRALAVRHAEDGGLRMADRGWKEKTAGCRRSWLPVLVNRLN